MEFSSIVHLKITSKLPPRTGLWTEDIFKQVGAYSPRISPWDDSVTPVGHMSPSRYSKWRERALLAPGIMGWSNTKAAGVVLSTFGGSREGAAELLSANLDQQY